MTQATSISRFNTLKQLIETDPADRHYFVDFDHTLLLTNSTDLFINSARPRYVFWPLFKALGLLRPWILMGKNSTLLWRDPVRVKLAHFLQGKGMARFFSESASQLWRQKKNAELCNVLSEIPIESITIVSFGVDEVIQTLLKGTEFEHARIIAPTLSTLTKERRKGKVGMMRERGVFFNKNRDVVITDSATDDADLLARVENGFHIEWHPT